MPWSLPEIVAALGGDLGSPRVITEIDKVIRHLSELRKIAVSLHGEPTPAPDQQPTPNQETREKDEGQRSDRTVGDLAERYKADPNSPYKALRYRTRVNYDSLMRRILNNSGHWKLVDLKEPSIQALYDGWVEGGKTTQAHGLITMLRGLVHFGANKLEDSECVRLSVILRNMTFKAPKARTEAMTAEQATKIINKAHEMELPSIALAQAFQFDCQLKQRDVIGEWVPIEEKTGPSEIIDRDRGMKWIRGLRWSEIDKDLVLRHVTSLGSVLLEVRLSEAPLVRAELRRIRAERGGTLPQSGAIIERKPGLPWDDLRYRRAWRKVADAAGIPKSLKNMDKPRAATAA